MKVFIMKVTNFIFLFVFYSILLLVSYSSLASNGSVDFTLHPINKNMKNNSWSIVVPNFLIKNNSHFILLNVKGHELSTEFHVTATWPHKSGPTYIRSIIINPIQLSKNSNKYTLAWSNNKNKNSSNKIPKISMSYHANLSASWLSKTFYAPTLSAKENKAVPWFDEAYQGYGRFITDKSFKERSKGLNQASIWLYDRTLALYLLYIKTGDLKWKKDAHDSAVFYQNHLDENGGFTLKAGDMKYSNSQGLLLDYIFYPEQGTRDNIHLIYKKSLIWSAKIKKEGFWTERHHSIALTSAISYWTLTGDPDASKRIQQFLNEITLFLNSPYNQNCLQHPFESHEGWKLATKVCSPWMSALLIEQLWRYYHLALDFKSISIIERLTRFLVGPANFKYSFKNEVTAIPKYLVYLSPSLNEKEDAWMDYQHACDVASAIAKGAYAQQILGEDTKQSVNILNLMLRSCYRSMYRGHRNHAWPIAPIRKFNWWYSSSGSLTWLLNYHDVSYNASYIP